VKELIVSDTQIFAETLKLNGARIHVCIHVHAHTRSADSPFRMPLFKQNKKLRYQNGVTKMVPKWLLLVKVTFQSVAIHF